MTRARNIAGFSTITTTPSPIHVGPIGVLTATRIDGEFGVVDIQARTIEAVSIAATNFQVSGITTGLNVSGIITAQNGINFNGTSTGLNVSGVGTIATLDVNGNGDISGNLTVTGNVSVGGTLTYEDVTNVDSVGVITAREQVHVGTGVSIAAGGLNVTAGISTFGGGIQLDDTISHIGDTNTKIRFPDNDQISFETGGVERMIIGVGGDISIQDTIKHAGDTNTKIRFPAADTFSVETGGVERLRIIQSGNIGIGSAIPADKFDVNGNVIFGAKDTSDAQIQLGRDGSGDRNAYIDLIGDNTYTDYGLRLIRVNGGANASSQLLHRGTGTFSIQTQEASQIDFRTSGNNTRLSITSVGKVGIGTNLPQEELTIMSSTPALMLRDSDQPGSYTQVSNANQDMYFSANGASAHANFIFRSGNNGSFTERLRSTSGGNVNIGGEYTNTTSTLRVIGDSSGGSQTYLEKNSGSTNNTYNTSLTISSRSTGSAAANYGPAIGFQHAFGSSNYAGCLIASQCNSDVNAADLVFYPRNYGYTEALRINSSGQLKMTNTTTKTFAEFNTTNNSTRAIIRMDGKDSSGNIVSLRMGGFGDTQRGEVFTQTNHDLGFATNNAAAQFKCKTGGNFEIVDGDLVIGTGGHGIDFSADGNASGSNNELLNDYEEGTWSPLPSDSNNTFATGQESGRYIKVGNIVQCTFTFNCSLPGTSGYAFFITGLPFTVKDYGSHANEGLGICKGTGVEIQLEAQQGQTRCKMRSPSTGAALTPNNVGSINNVTKAIRGTITYHTT